ncbi:ABC transporter substrate-binding protein [Mycetocola saprophilus]|uniref:ABC transporter substrate-binding protein n=1 Tax=Mycetocola saprophilus TaxID=76636 RepID=UPI00069034AC|nr:ABC transporter substrate-binding protein [Mycetocola saprophilus]
MTTKTLLPLTGLLLGGFLLSGCGQAVSTPDTGASGSASAVTLTNCGRTLSVDRAPERAVAMSPAQSEMLIKLGLADRVVAEAQTHGQPLAPELAKDGTVSQLSDQMPPSREVLLGVSPDFVYAPTTYEFTAEQGFADIAQLKAAGANAYVATAGCSDRRSVAEVSDLLEDITNLGQIFGVPERAATVANEAQAALDEVATRTAQQPKPSVAELFVEGTSISAIGAGIEYNMIQLAGGDNVFSPEDPAFASFFSAVISPETLIAKNPEAIVFTTLDAAHEQATRDYLRATFPQVAAVANDRLIAIASDDVMPGTWGNIRAVQQIAQGLHAS